MSGTCIVTGGARGIGRATALLAAERGYRVVVNYRERADAASAVVDAIRSGGGQAVAVGADVAVEADIVRLFGTAEDALGGPITAVVNSAGIGYGAPCVAFERDAIARMMDLNVVGLMLCCREAARRMALSRGGQGGAIVNVSSMAATIGGREGARSGGHTRQRGPTGDDADRHDRRRASRSRAPTRCGRDDPDAALRQAQGDRCGDLVPPLRRCVLHLWHPSQRLGRGIPGRPVTPKSTRPT